MKKVILLLTVLVCIFACINVQAEGITVYDNYIGYYDGMYVLEINGKTLLIDRTGIPVGEFDLNGIDKLSSDVTYFLKYNGNTYMNKIENMPYRDVYFNNTSENESKYRIISENGKYGVSDIEGNIIIECCYDQIVQAGNYFGIKLECEFGMADTTGKIIIPVEYDEICEFQNGVAVLRKGEEFGAINTDGKIIVPFSDKQVSFLIGGIIRQGGLLEAGGQTAYNINGEKILDGYHIHAKYKEGYLVQNIDTMKFGVINDAGKTVIPFKHNFLYCPVLDSDVYCTDKGLIIDKKEVRLNFEPEISDVDKQGYIFFRTEDGKKGILNPSGELCIYTDCYKLYSNGDCVLVHTKEDKYIVLPKEWKTIPGMFMYQYKDLIKFSSPDIK